MMQISATEAPTRAGWPRPSGKARRRVAFPRSSRPLTSTRWALTVCAPSSSQPSGFRTWSGGSSPCGANSLRRTPSSSYSRVVPSSCRAQATRFTDIATPVSWLSAAPLVALGPLLSFPLPRPLPVPGLHSRDGAALHPKGRVRGPTARALVVSAVQGRRRAWAASRGVVSRGSGHANLVLFASRPARSPSSGVILSFLDGPGRGCLHLGRTPKVMGFRTEDATGDSLASRHQCFSLRWMGSPASLLPMDDWN